MKRILLVVGMLAIGLGAVSAQQDVVAQRQKLMKDNGKNLGGVLGGSVGGEVGSRIGEKIDQTYLLNHECRDCGHGFR